MNKKQADKGLIPVYQFIAEQEYEKLKKIGW